jgi:hypothetical protein
MWIFLWRIYMYRVEDRTISPDVQIGMNYMPWQGMFQCPLVNCNVAVAKVMGGPDYPRISGVVLFRNVPGGTEVCADIAGLPAYQPAKDGKQPIGPFGFHIHEKGDCTVGDPAKPFEASG